MRTQCLVVYETDSESQRRLGSYFGTRGYDVRLAQTAADFWRRLSVQGVDAVIVRLSALGAAPLDTLLRVRASTPATIIALDASTDELDRILALELGADDYLATPCNPRELLARLRAIERRAAVAQCGAHVEYRIPGGRFRVDERRIDRSDGTSCTLSTTESAVLHALVRAPRTLLSRDRLRAAVHPGTAVAGERSVDVTIARLRRKVGSLRSVITTERGGGYRFNGEVSAETTPRLERRGKPRGYAVASPSSDGDELAQRCAVSNGPARAAGIEID
jgi:two-component system OmpR family response regulator